MSSLRNIVSNNIQVEVRLWPLPFLSNKINEDFEMKKFSILTLIVLILSPVIINAQENKTIIFKAGINKVTFKSQGVKLAGLLFTPDNFDPTKKYPTIVFSGPLLQVKEQMGTNYGKAFADKGYVFLSFDHIGHGESEGDMGAHENGNLKTEGIRDAISYLRTLKFVNRDRLFGLGGCASGGYMPFVAVTDKRLKGVATVSGMNNNIFAYFGRSDKDKLIAMFLEANEARQRMYETGKLETVDPHKYFFGKPYEGNKMEDFPEGSAREGYEYYMTKRGRTANYTHRAKANLQEYGPMVDATTYAEYIFMPFIGVVGENAGSKIFTQNFYDKAKEPKELVVIKGASHVDLYDKVDYIEQAVNKIDDFFNKHVK